MFKKSTFFLLLLASASPLNLYSYTGLNNSGIISGNIWFSKTPFFEGELIRIYTAVYNSSDATLEGDVNFYDSGNLLGTKRFAVPSGGNLQDVYINWKAAEGEHHLSAKIANAQVSQSGGKPEAVIVGTDKTAEKPVTVEIDSDGDQLSNNSEIRNGTDPKKPDTDGDTIPDNLDKLPLDKYNGNPPPAPAPNPVPAPAPAPNPSPLISAVNKILESSGNGPIVEYGTKATAVADQVDTSVESVQSQVRDYAASEIKRVQNEIAGNKTSTAAATTTSTTISKSAPVKPKSPSKSVIPESVRTPFGYAKLAFWYIVYFLFYSTWTLYLLILLILYLLFKWWRRRREYYA